MSNKDKHNQTNVERADRIRQILLVKAVDKNLVNAQWAQMGGLPITSYRVNNTKH